jgi:hypothetical protein
MFPELRAVQIEVPGDVLEMREGSGEAPAHEAGAFVRLTCRQKREVEGEVGSADVTPLTVRTSHRVVNCKTSCFGLLD